MLQAQQEQMDQLRNAIIDRKARSKTHFRSHFIPRQVRLDSNLGMIFGKCLNSALIKFIDCCIDLLTATKFYFELDTFFY